MYWVIFFSAWGGFILGVLFMAILSMVREDKKIQGRFAQEAPFAPPQN